MPLDGSPEKNKTLTDVQKVLLGAADYMRDHGLCKGKGRDADTGSVCTIGAIVMAGGIKEVYDEAERTLTKHLGIGRHNLAPWSDAPERTAKDVINALESAAYSEV